MTDSTKSVLAAGAVVGASLAFLGGMVVRDGADLGAARVASNGPAALTVSPDLLASRTGEVDARDSRYLAQIIEVLDRTYVEPIKGEDQLGPGAVRGMVASLGDLDSLFFEPGEFAAYQARARGQYEGIGADFRFVLDGPVPKDGAPEIQTEADAADDRGRPLPIPKLTVAAVAPGGPAAKAGMLPGDTIAELDGKWVVNAADIESVRKLQEAARDPKLSAGAKADAQRAFLQERKRIVDRMKHGMLPTKAMTALVTGKDGQTAVTWLRGAKRMSAAIEKSSFSLPEIERTGEGVRFRFVTGIGRKLQQEIGDLDAVVLDLRGVAVGDFGAMQEALAAVGPSGDYGEIVTEREAESAHRPIPIRVADGRTSPLRVTILVDEGTQGVAAIFAKALVASGVAKLDGTLTSQRLKVVEAVPLPDGSGYTLTRGLFQPNTQAVAIR
ncbi:MAG: PDZ domain-containing protein [Fimbriimonadaceae bacterium]|nr:PDZ domain-containing protein [Fimbriimonadaceae bacterium]